MLSKVFSTISGFLLITITILMPKGTKRPRSRMVLSKIGKLVENNQKIEWIIAELKWPWYGLMSECFVKLIELLDERFGIGRAN